MALSQDALAALFTEAAEAGTEAFNAIAKAKIATDKAQTKAQAASDVVAGMRFEANGFNAPRFKGMVRVAKAFQRAFNDPDADGADDAAKGMAASYMTTMTGATEKTKNGGRAAGVAKVIKLGNHAETVAFALQQRIEHWQSVLDQTPEGETASDRKARVDLATRYLVPASCDKGTEDKPKTPRHNGRPQTVIGDVTIEAAQGTNRDSQLAQAANLFAVYGGAFLDHTVLDAFLDNGGRFEKPGDSLAVRAKKLAGLLLEIMEEGGDSPDVVNLDLAVKTLDAITAREGFSEKRQPTTPNNGKSTVAAPAALPATPPADDLLDGIIADLPPEAVLSGETAPAPAPVKRKKPGIAV